MPNEVTQEAFRIFETECRRLHRLFLLDTWALQVELGTDDDAHTDAELVTNVEGRVLTLRLARWLSKKPTRAYLKHVARHEMLHAVTQPVSRLARERWSMPQQVDQASHEVLNRLDVLLPR